MHASHPGHGRAERDDRRCETEGGTREHEVLDRAHERRRDDRDRHGGRSAAHEAAVARDGDQDREREREQQSGPRQAVRPGERQGAEHDPCAERRSSVRPHDRNRRGDRGHGRVEATVGGEDEGAGAETDEPGDLVGAQSATVPSTRTP